MNMEQDIIIDVTKIEPRLKHPSIFKAFDYLDDGVAVIIHNDHDPKPLYYQLLGERGNTFSWAYLENGPELWRVEIRKNISTHKIETIGDIAAKDLRKAEVFKKYGLDFCCGGKKTLEDSCKEKGLDVLQVKAELEDTVKINTLIHQHNYNSWNLTFLIDYIVNVHHAYVKNNIPIIEDLCAKVTEHHGKQHPELLQINALVELLFSEIKTHLNKEEKILFPYIKQLELSNLSGSNVHLGFCSVLQPISFMEKDHEVVGKLGAEIKELSKDYTLPADACNSYYLLYKKLEEFENDLHLHIHLENNILFPKAIELEKY